jgi:hypothetical protein
MSYKFITILRKPQKHGQARASSEGTIKSLGRNWAGSQLCLLTDLLHELGQVAWIL